MLDNELKRECVMMMRRELKAYGICGAKNNLIIREIYQVPDLKTQFFRMYIFLKLIYISKAIPIKI